MFRRIKEPTYSELETYIYKGTNRVANNIFFQDSILEKKSFANYARIYGALLYIVAGWRKNGNVDLSVNVVTRFGKRIEAYSNTKYALSLMNELDSGYKAVREATEKTMKTTLDVSSIFREQAVAILVKCGSNIGEQEINYVVNNLSFFTSNYLDSKTGELMPLPTYAGSDPLIVNEDIPNLLKNPNCAIAARETNDTANDSIIGKGKTLTKHSIDKKRGIISSFYNEISNRGYGGWFSFHFKFRLPVSFLIDLGYTLYYIFTDTFLGIIATAILVLDAVLIYKTLERTKKSYFYLNSEFIFWIIINLLIVDYRYAAGSIVWSVFSIFYFRKYKEFFLGSNDEFKDTIDIHGAESAMVSISNAEIRFCRKCGESLILPSGFCSKCGAKIDWLSELNKADVINGEKEEIERQNDFVEDKIVLAAEPKLEITDEKMSEIRKWKQLLDEGILTEEEFSTKKKDVLKI